MKKLILFLMLLLPSVALGEEKSYGNAIATVMYVHDGDTLTVTLDGEWPDLIGSYIGVRVEGIDTRELNDGGTAAREYVRKLLKVGDQIFLREMKRDKYFRIVAHVGYKCKDLNEEAPMCADLGLKLIQEKYAIPYDGKTKSKFPKEIK